MGFDAAWSFIRPIDLQGPPPFSSSVLLFRFVSFSSDFCGNASGFGYFIPTSTNFHAWTMYDSTQRDNTYFITREISWFRLSRGYNIHLYTMIVLYIYTVHLQIADRFKTHLQDQGRRLPLRAAPLEVILEAMVNPMKHTLDLEAVLVEASHPPNKTWPWKILYNWRKNVRWESHLWLKPATLEAKPCHQMSMQIGKIWEKTSLIGNGRIIPTDELIFFRGVGLNHQPEYNGNIVNYSVQIESHRVLVEYFACWWNKKNIILVIEFW